jgi:hypothetical protein
VEESELMPRPDPEHFEQAQKRQRRSQRATGVYFNPFTGRDD